MILFLDTSSLLKLYHFEDGTERVQLIFQKEKITGMVLSRLTEIEFQAAKGKKIRTGEIKEHQARSVIKTFMDDQGKFSWIEFNHVLMNEAKRLVAKYLKEGLRTLDSIQLASALEALERFGKGKVIFETSDSRLLEIAKKEHRLKFP